MGAWGTAVLHNDRALDMMYDVKEKPTVATVKSLIRSRYEDEALLGIALVDANQNGVDENIFGSLYEYADVISGLPDMSALVPSALDRLNTIALDKNALQNWFRKEDQRARKALYKGLQKRLSA